MLKRRTLAGSTGLVSVFLVDRKAILAGSLGVINERSGERNAGRIRLGGVLRPRCILEKLDCVGVAGDVVEFGCGYGTFTIPAAEALDEQVFALDIEAELVSRTASKAEMVGLTNVIAEQRDFVATGSGRPTDSAAYVMLFNILHIENPVGLLQEARRTLMPGAKVGIIHWRDDIPTPRGPSRTIRPKPDVCRVWAETAD